VAALALKILTVDVPSAVAEAASNHDLIIQAVEVESIAENVLSVIYNQGVNYDHIRTEARNSTAVVRQTIADSTDSIETAIDAGTQSTAATVNAAAGECNLK
jgi:hypothetical protein